MRIRIALLSIVLALTICSALAFIFFFFLRSPVQEISLKEFLTGSATAIATLITAVGNIFGLVHERNIPVAIAQTHRAPSIRSGLYSGLIAGAISGAVIGTLYYVNPQNNDVSWERIPAVFVFGTATGALLGVAIQSGISLFYNFMNKHHLVFAFNEVTGAMLGGAIGGILAGALGGATFFPMNGMVIDPWLLFGASVLGMVIIVLGTLRYDYEGHWRDILPSLLIALLVTAFVAGVVVFLIPEMGFLTDGSMLIRNNLVLEWLCAGAILGFLVGIVLGLEVGLGLLVYRALQPRAAG